MITTSAPGKMILLGEYAVLEGAPALVCAVNRRAAVSMESRTGNQWALTSPALEIKDLPFVLTTDGQVRFDPHLEPVLNKRLQFFSRLFESALEYTKLQQKSLCCQKITLDTSEFYSRELQSKFGFGSSAAMAVALFGAVLKSAEIISEDISVFEQVLKAHHIAQGHLGSGIDVAASFFGGVLVYQMAENGQVPQKPLLCPAVSNIHFLPVWTGHSTSTRKMVRGVDQLKETHPQLFTQLMEQLSALSEKGCTAYRTDTASVFLDCVAQFFEALDQLGTASGMPIISENHRTLGRLAAQEGLVYKPSGAGGGDIGLFFSDDRQRLQALKPKLQEQGYVALEIEIAGEGLLVSDTQGP